MIKDRKKKKRKPRVKERDENDVTGTETIKVLSYQRWPLNTEKISEKKKHLSWMVIDLLIYVQCLGSCKCGFVCFRSMSWGKDGWKRKAALGFYCLLLIIHDHLSLHLFLFYIYTDYMPITKSTHKSKDLKRRRIVDAVADKMKKI